MRVDKVKVDVNPLDRKLRYCHYILSHALKEFRIYATGMSPEEWSELWGVIIGIYHLASALYREGADENRLRVERARILEEGE